MLLDKLEDSIITLCNKSELSLIQVNILESLQSTHSKMLKDHKKMNWTYCSVLIIDSRHEMETF